MNRTPIEGTRFVWVEDANRQAWCVHEGDDTDPVGLYDARDPKTGFARAAVLRHRQGFALFVADPSCRGPAVRALNAASPDVLRTTYEKRLPHKRTR